MKAAIRWRVVASAAGVLGLLILAGAGGYLHTLSARWAHAADQQWTPTSGGTLIICGGGRMPDEIRDCFVACAGGRRAKIVVIPACTLSDSDRRALIDEWRVCHVASVDLIGETIRVESESTPLAEAISRATGVWISGGDQGRLANLYADTDVERQLQALLNRDGVIGGISAGAAAMTQVMIRGEGDQVNELRGFNLLHGAVVDQHFFRRNRAQRLLDTIARHPDLVGLGIDEHTAVVVQHLGTRWSVIGESYAMIYLPSGGQFPRLEVLKTGDAAEIDALRENPAMTADNSPDEDAPEINGT